MPANLMDLGSGSSVSKKDAKLGFVVNYTNLLLIPGPDGQYFTTANLWTRDQGQASSLTNDFDYVSVG